MTISIITPTSERPHFLRGLHTLLQKQTYGNWEWHILDNSLRPLTFDDPRVHYTHTTEIVSIGEARNRLIEQTKGEIIVHCDDDDYYAPTYLAHMIDKLHAHAFFNLHSWFSYDMKTAQIYYWATDEEHRTQYILNEMTGSRIREIDLGPHMDNQKEKLNIKGRTGYGFSYAYRREVAEKCAFPDCDFGEDRHFYNAVEEAGYPILMEADHTGQAIHVIHDANTSSEYPQYRIPRFLIADKLAPFFTHMTRYED